MPMGRMIQKAICQSKKLARLKTDGARLLYTWIIPNVDINGCYSGDAKVIKGQVFTRLNHSVKTVESYLQDMERIRLIVRYEANGDIFLIIPDFRERQGKLQPEREALPTIPLPTPEQLQTNSGVSHTQIKVNQNKVNQNKEKDLGKDLTTGDESPDKRNPELQSLINFATIRGFSMQGSKKQNRYYAYNLMRKKDSQGELLGAERVKKLIVYAIDSRGKEYAPQIDDFKQLFYKWQNLLSFIDREKNKKGRIG